MNAKSHGEISGKMDVIENEWILDYLAQVSKTKIWNEKIRTFVIQNAGNFNKIILYSDENLALYENYKELYEDYLFEILSESEIPLTTFENLLNNINNELIVKYEHIIFPFFAIINFQCFVKFMTNPYPQCNSTLLINSDENDVLEKVIQYSKDSYERVEKALDDKFEADIAKGISLSKNDYHVYQKRLKIEKKMLEKAIELSIKEIELKEAEENLAINLDKQVKIIC